MDVPPPPPPEPTPNREAPSRQMPTSKNSSQGLVDAKIQGASQAPTSGGVLAASHAEGGGLREAAERRDTKERNSIAETIRRITGDAGLVGNTRLAIEIDEKTDAPRFLILSKKTGEILRTVPHEDILPLLRDLTQHHGAIVDRRV